jgi:hypothetical protein
VDSQLPVIAKWEHIVKLCKRGKDGRIHMLYKLTDTRLSPVAQCAMKVSLAVLVGCHHHDSFFFCNYMCLGDVCSVLLKKSVYVVTNIDSRLLDVKEFIVLFV